MTLLTALRAGALLCVASGAGETARSARPAKAKLVVCYVESMTGGARPAELDLGVCTHVIEAFLLPDASGALRAANGLPRQELIHAARAGGSRVLVAIGGATVPGATFSAIASSEPKRRAFAEAAARFAADNGYDGVDLDWEFPTPREGAAHLGLTSALRESLRAAFRAAGRDRDPIVAVGVTPGAHLEGYDFPGLAQAADLFIHFGYDFRNPALGPWAHDGKLWPDGSRRPIESSVRGAASELIRRGVPREKLVIGLPFYASDGRPWAAIRDLALASKARLQPQWLEKEIDGAWVNDPEAIAAKARKICFGEELDGGAAAGVALWQLGHQGAFRDLTDALRGALGAPQPL